MKEALYISWVGMSLVFVGLMALWGMMAAVVRLTTPRKVSKPVATALPIEDVDDKDLDGKRKAAAAAVTAAMALINTSFTASPHTEKDLISPWQAAHRGRQDSINQNSRRRKD